MEILRHRIVILQMMQRTKPPLRSQRKNQSEAKGVSAVTVPNSHHGNHGRRTIVFFRAHMYHRSSLIALAPESSNEIPRGKMMVQALRVGSPKRRDDSSRSPTTSPDTQSPEPKHIQPITSIPTRVSHHTKRTHRESKDMSRRV